MRAYKLRQLAGFSGEAWLYRLDPPLHEENWWDGDDKVSADFEYVVSSAAYAMFSGPETYVFPADADGNVTKWGELEPSRKGIMDPDAVLEDAGYEIVREDTDE